MRVRDCRARGDLPMASSHAHNSAPTSLARRLARRVRRAPPCFEPLPCAPFVCAGTETLNCALARRVAQLRAGWGGVCGGGDPRPRASPSTARPLRCVATPRRPHGKHARCPLNSSFDSYRCPSASPLGGACRPPGGSTNGRWRARACPPGGATAPDRQPIGQYKATVGLLNGRWVGRTFYSETAHWALLWELRGPRWTVQWGAGCLGE